MFTAVTLITLAIGVGANTAIYRVLDGVLLKPLPHPQAGDLVGAWHTAAGLNIKELGSPPSAYFICRERSPTSQDIGLYTGDSVNVTGVGEPRAGPRAPGYRAQVAHPRHPSDARPLVHQQR